MGNQKIIDQSDLRKYRTELPNLYDDMGLDPYEFRLLAHYKRVGNCYESVATTAKKCCMSVGMVSKTRRALAEKGIIVIDDNPRGTSTITVVDVWEQNFERYSGRSPHERERSPHERERSPHERERSPHEQGRSPHETKKEPIKKEPIKKVSRERERTPLELETMELSQLFCELTGVEWQEPSSRRAWAAAKVRWIDPLREIIARANGSSRRVLSEAVKAMQKDGLTISAPQSVLQSAIAISGKRNLSDAKEAGQYDPFEPLTRMLEERERNS